MSNYPDYKISELTEVLLVVVGDDNKEEHFKSIIPKHTLLDFISTTVNTYENLTEHQSNGAWLMNGKLAAILTTDLVVRNIGDFPELNEKREKGEVVTDPTANLKIRGEGSLELVWGALL